MISRDRREFACTSLGLIVRESCAACLQVGDGTPTRLVELTKNQKMLTFQTYSSEL